MANQITGKVIAVAPIETITSQDPSKQPFQKRKLLIDCTRYDPYTGERGHENTPMLEFGGKGLEQLNQLINQGLKKGDLVTIDFVVEGRNYKDQSGKTQNFTGVRPFAIVKRVLTQQQATTAPQAQGQQPQQAAPAPAPQHAPVQQPQQPIPDDGLPF
jgi:hypothetical protein